ncbi:MCE family protein [Dissulfurirhabdus thermomarina]|uniref:MCE family protein n=1 Tax=Dissulfurirhabdus thermomarina TaxID=1765737 RepID=A0A6N9TR22_DISTH|nr:MlaD family protein [Dissulfurirhabdus thermomarina]NDY42553.1 MCE family protein [Dissulfurirhabdus thermomarina]NMX23688.1 MCE family protein [Dissulfurirhabdus thermomarina]
MNSGRHKTEMVVGVFVLFALLVLGYMSLRLGGEAFAPREGYPLVLHLDTAAGLAPNSRVEMAGVEIGRVTAVRVEDGGARVDLSIYAPYAVARDAEAWVRTKGILGDKFVEIRQGDLEAGVLGPGEAVARVVRPRDLDELFVEMGPVLQDLKKVANGLGRVVGSEENIENVRETLANLRSASGSLKRLTADIEQGRGTLGKLVKDDRLYREAEQTVASLRRLTAKVERGEGTMGRLFTDESLYEDTRATVRTLQAVAMGLEAGNGTMGKLLKDESLYVEVKKALRNVNKAAEGVQEQIPVTIIGTLVGTAVR